MSGSPPVSRDLRSLQDYNESLRRALEAKRSRLATSGSNPSGVGNSSYPSHHAEAGHTGSTPQHTPTTPSTPQRAAPSAPLSSHTSYPYAKEEKGARDVQILYDNLLSQNAMLESQVNILAMEKETLGKETNELRMVVVKEQTLREAQVEQQKNAIQNLEKDNAQLRTQISERDSAIIQLQAQTTSLQIQISTLEKDFAAVQARRKALEEESSRWMHDVSSLETQHGEQSETVRTLEAKIRAMQVAHAAEESQLQSRISEMELEVDQKDSALKVAKKAAETYSKLSEERQEALAALRDEYTSQMRHADWDLQESRTSVQQLEALCREKDGSVNRVKQELDASLVREKDLRECVATLENQIQSLKAERQEASSAFERDVEQLKSAFRDAEQQMQSVLSAERREKERFAQQLEEVKRTRDDALSRALVMDSEKRQSTTEKDSKIDMLSGQIALLEKDKAILEERIANLQRERDAAEHRLLSDGQERLHLMDNVGHLQEMWATLNAEHERLRSSLSKQELLVRERAAERDALSLELQQQRQSITADVSRLESFINARDDEIRRLMDDNAGLVRSLETFESHKESLLKDMQQLRQVLEDHDRSSREKIQQLQESLLTTRHERDSALADSQKMYAETIRLGEQISTLRLESGTLEQRLQEATARMQTRDSEHNIRVERQKKEATDICRELGKEKEELLTELSNMQKMLKDSQEKISHLSRRLLEGEKDRNRMDSEFKQREVEYEEKLKTCMISRDRSEAKFREREDELARLKRALGKQEQLLQEAQSRWDILAGDHAKLQQDKISAVELAAVLQGRVDDLQKNLDARIREIEQCQGQYSSQLTSLSVEKEQVVRKLEEMGSELMLSGRDFQTTLKERDRQIERLSDDLAKTRLELTQVSAKRAELESSLSRATDEFNREKRVLVTRLGDVEEENASLKDENIRLSDQLALDGKSATTQYADVFSRWEASDRARRTAEEAAMALRSDLDALRVEYEDTQRTLNRERTESNSRISEVLASADRMEEALRKKDFECSQHIDNLIAESQKREDEFKRERDHLQQDVHSLKVEVERVSSDSRRWKNEFDSMRASHLELQSQFSLLRDEGVSKETKLASEVESEKRASRMLATKMEERLTAADEFCARMQKELAGIMQFSQLQDAEVDRLRSNVAVLAADLANGLSSDDALSRQFESLCNTYATETDSLKSALSAEHQECERLSADLASKESLSRELESELSFTKDRLSMISQDYERISQKLRESEAAMARLIEVERRALDENARKIEMENAGLRDALNLKHVSLSEAESKLAALDTKYRTNVNRMEALGFEVSELKVQIRSLQEENAHLREDHEKQLSRAATEHAEHSKRLEKDLQQTRDSLDGIQKELDACRDEKKQVSQKSKQAVDALQQRIRQVEQQLTVEHHTSAQSQRDCEGLRAAVQQREQVILQWKSKAEDSLRERDNLASELISLRTASKSDGEKKEALIRDLQHQADRMSTKLQELGNRLDLVSRELGAEREKCDSISRERDDLVLTNQQLENLRTDDQSKVLQLSALQKRISDLESLNKDLTVQVQSAQQSLILCESQLRDCEKLRQSDLQSFKEEMKDFEKEHLRLMSDKDAQLDHFQKLLSESQLQVETAIGRATQLENRLQDELRSRHRDADAHRGELEAHDSTMTTLEKENRDLRVEIDGLMSSFQGLTAELQSSRQAEWDALQRLDELKAVQESLSREIEALRGHARLLEEEVSRTRTETASLQVRLRDLQDERDSALEKVQKSQANAHQMSEQYAMQLRQLQSLMNQAQQQKKNAEDEYRRLFSAHAQMSGDGYKTNTDISVSTMGSYYQEQISSLQRRLQSLVQDNFNLSASVSKQQTEIEKKTADVVALQQREQDLIEQIHVKYREQLRELELASARKISELESQIRMERLRVSASSRPSSAVAVPNVSTSGSMSPVGSAPGSFAASYTTLTGKTPLRPAPTAASAFRTPAQNSSFSSTSSSSKYSTPVSTPPASKGHVSFKSSF
eukprot:ANDGO_07704.mRNA.1 hypothetical protein